MTSPARPDPSREEPAELSVVVDPVACDAFGYCAELLPGHVTLDEWGYPVVKGEPVPPDLAAAAADAARQCPRRALLLVRRVGSTSLGTRP